MEKILTVTVPAYNAEPWLATNLDSLCGSGPAEDLEILVIDDGSIDGTGKLADSYEARFPGIVRVIHKENGGHGSGINRGIREASGKYFKVIDADDWVRPDAFARFLDFLRSADSDIVASGFYWAYDDGSGNPYSFRTEAEIAEPFPGVRFCREYRFDEIADRIYLKIHNFTIRTEILKAHMLPLDEQCFYVDTEFIAYPIPWVETVIFFPEFVYMYRIGTAGQSVSMERMQRNARNYDRVLNSMFLFYDSPNVKNCGKKKQVYIARITARALAARLRIFLSFPPSAKTREKLVRYDRMVRRMHKDIYAANVNRGVTLLRFSGYLLYWPASALVRKKYG